MKTLDTNVVFFLEIQSQLKIFHWQTKGYARHQAFGMVYDELDGLIDQFVEVAMGKYGRFTLSEKGLKIQNLSELKPESLIEKSISKLNEITKELKETDTDLLNIKDEMLALFNKLSYLLTLE